MAAPSRWISHDFPTTRRPPCAERVIGDRRRSGRCQRARWLRQQFCGGVAEATLIEDEEVEPREVRRDQGELLSQGRLRQA